jgi:hypothetical protein
MKTLFKKMLTLVFITSLLGTNAFLTANPWKRFAPQAEALLKKTLTLAKEKGAVAITLATPFGSPFIFGGYHGRKKAAANTLNKTEKVTLGVFGLRVGAQAAVQNIIVIHSPLKTSLKAALSSITFAVPTISYAIGYSVGKLTTTHQKKNIATV